jgi:glycosyltransferase involved in cell wall biosynthesis
LRIGIFVVTPGRQGGGPETYEIQLIRALARLDHENQYFIYCTVPEAVNAIGVDKKNFTFRVLRPRLRWISIPLVLPLLLLKDRVDFYHATMVPAPWSPRPLILTILCSSNWTHPEFYEKSVVWRLNKLLDRGLQQAKKVLCISKFLVEEVHQTAGVPYGSMSVSYMGVGPEFSPRDKEASKRLVEVKYSICAPYFLFIGQQQERKNVFRVIEAYAQFRQMAGDGPDLPRLVIVGREPSMNDPIFDTIQSNNVGDHTTRILYVPFAEVPELYCGADALLFPSLWEGFGLPIIESMACGTPVITSTATCLPEIAGDAALVVNPESAEEIAQAILRLHLEPELRSRLVREGFTRARIFSWEACAVATLEAYKGMVSNAQAAR